MWHAIFAEQISSGEKVLRTVLVYTLIVVLIRLTGKRGLAGLNTLDIVVMILLSNIVQNAIIGNDLSVTGAAIGAGTLIVVNAALNRAVESSAFVAKLFDGTPTQVIANGKVLHKAMRRIGLRQAELETAVRMQNGDDLDQVESGSMEPGGQLVLTLRESEQGATKADVARLTAQLERIERALRTSS